MRTNIDIDDDLLAEAMEATGQTSKKATVDAAFRAVVEEHKARKALRKLWGIGWDGDLEKQRQEWEFDPEPLDAKR